MLKSQLFKFQLLNGTNLIPQNHTNISRFERVPISFSADVRNADRNVRGESDSALNSNSDLENVIHALFYLLYPSFPFWLYYICLSDFVWPLCKLCVKDAVYTMRFTCFKQIPCAALACLWRLIETYSWTAGCQCTCGTVFSPPPLSC